MSKYQDIYPSDPELSSVELKRTSIADLLTLEYFEAEPDSMPTQVFDQHHILINLNPNPHRVENWRDGVHRDFTYYQNEIVVTPAGVESGWRWHDKSKVIVITLEPLLFEQFAQNEVGVLLTEKQLNDIPVFVDEDITQSAENLYLSLETKALGYELMFESLARVFLIKLIQKYAQTHEQQLNSKTALSAARYKKVLDFVKANYANPISLEDLAKTANMSPHHFSRLFKQTIGKSPMQYVQGHRVEEAKKLLTDKNLPLINVADRCGFADQSHFSRSFKQHTGQTPKQYRQKSSS